jgi:hypothetical protein
MLCEKNMTMQKQRVHFHYHKVPNKQHQQKHKVIQGRFTSITQIVV